MSHPAATSHATAYPMKAGLFGIGLDTYWPQFPGLKDRLEMYLCAVGERLFAAGATNLLNLGLVDSYERAIEAGHRARREEADILFLYATTYALSATVLPLVQLAGVPVVVLNLAPAGAIDYAAFNALPGRAQMTAEWLSFCSPCPVPEIINVLKKAGLAHYQVTGTLDPDDSCWREAGEYLTAATVKKTLFHTRLGCMGHYYSGMLDIYTDYARISSRFGTHLEMIEVDELSAMRAAVALADVHERATQFRDLFDVQPDCSADELVQAAQTSVALDRLVEKYRLGALAYYYKGTGNKANENTIRTIIPGTSVLTANGVPVAGEYEIKNAVAMKIMDLIGAGGSFTEYYAMDYNDNVVLMGHDGPGHLAIAEGKPKMKPLEVYHGKVGMGLSVEMSVKHGPVTLLSLVESSDGGLKMVAAEGESVPGPILQIGNTNSRYRFAPGIRTFVARWNEEGPAHHCAVGTGHVVPLLKKIGELCQVPVVQVC